MGWVPVTKTSLESDKNDKKPNKKTKMAITRATWRPRSSRDVHFVAFCARIRLEWVPVTKTSLESDKNEKKPNKKTKMAITRATRRPRSSRDVHFVALCARIRLEWVPVTKTCLESDKNEKKPNKKTKRAITRATRRPRSSR